MIRLTLILLVGYFLIFTTGCTVTQKYNSLDLAELPCELGNSTRFFTPFEFTDSGDFLFEDQLDAIKSRLKDQQPLSRELRNRKGPVTDLVFFLHGWNKNAASAESDYQNFLCRLHSRMRNLVWDSKRKGGLMVVGIFWRSTITNREQEPTLLKPFSYFQVRKRADQIARSGLAKLFTAMTPWMARNRGQSQQFRTHLIGHSFGGRMLITAMEQMSKQESLVDFLSASSRTNVALLNPAVDSARFTWIAKEVAKASPASPARLTSSTNSYLFNLYSENDTANRYLFRLASMFNSDESGCAVGACGVAGFPKIPVSSTGKHGSPVGPDQNPEINAWNVDTTQIVFDHSDIYKGRMAALLVDLLYCYEVDDRRLKKRCKNE